MGYTFHRPVILMVLQSKREAFFASNRFNLFREIHVAKSKNKTIRWPRLWCYFVSRFLSILCLPVVLVTFVCDAYRMATL